MSPNNIQLKSHFSKLYMRHCLLTKLPQSNVDQSMFFNGLKSLNW